MTDASNTDGERETLLEFPCDFPIKAFGKKEDEFRDRVFEIVRAHVPELAPEDVTARESSGGKYLAVTALIVAQNQAQLDAIYGDLTRSGAVLMSL